MLSWLAPLSFIGTLLGLATIVDALDAGEFRYAEIPWILLRHVGSGFAIGAVIGLMFYLGLSHRLAARVARSLTVTVDGPFLRIRQHGLTRSDRKLHFRSIVDYATRQDFLMRCFGVEALHMMTTAGGPASAVSILGVQDALATRDLLSDIDRLREAQ